VKREQLEHILRAASRIVDERDFLVIGSAAVLGTFGDDQLPYEASRSEEADIAPYNDPDGEKSLRVEGSLGQGSHFHATFGYFADGVDTCLGEDFDLGHSTIQVEHISRPLESDAHA